MTEKTIIKWIEKLFARQIEIALKLEEFSLQIPKKTAKILIEKGLVEEKTVVQGLLTMKFHRLSDFGNLYYCTSCKEKKHNE